MSEKSSATSEDAKVTIRLSPAAREAVDEVMRLGGFKSIQEAVRRAIGDELFLLRQRREGWDVLLRKGSDYREIVWTGPM